ncbi:MAG: dTMP kinase [Thermoanaerobacteraceae bacterium]|nr:dTMP kinase [Thermoanaerobacteraceae bacterium]
MSGFFITFEGPDGAGKTTQINKVAGKLRQLGKKVAVTREPGGTKLGEAIRNILLDPQQNNLCSEAEVLLYAAARAQHVVEVIKPALAEGKIVLCDRFLDSSIAYQGFGRKLNLDIIQTVNRYAVAGIKPDLTVLLDVPVTVGLQRIKSKGGLDRIESEKLVFHEQVRQGFYQLSRQEPDRFRVIDASRPVDVVSRQVWQVVAERLGDLQYEDDNHGGTG